MNRGYLWFLSIFLILGSFDSTRAASRRVFSSGPEVQTARTIAGDLEYTLTANRGAPAERIQLSKGFFEREEEGGPFRVQIIPDDPVLVVQSQAKKTAFITLWKSYGGTGNWEMLKEIQLSPGKPHEISSFPELKEDRASIKRLEIEGDTLVAQLLYHGKDDALCCPTQKQQLRYPLKAR